LFSSELIQVDIRILRSIIIYSQGDVQTSPYCRGVEQSNEERDRLISVAALHAAFQLRCLFDGVVVELIGIEFKRYVSQGNEMIIVSQQATPPEQRLAHDPKL